VVPEAPLQRGTDGLFRAADGDLAADPNARVQDGALEGSNVSAVETMVAMIAAARQFEQQMKVLQGAEQREQGARSCSGHRSRRLTAVHDPRSAAFAALFETDGALKSGRTSAQDIWTAPWKRRRRFRPLRGVTRTWGGPASCQENP
jgi:hypothetical protein